MSATTSPRTPLQLRLRRRSEHAEPYRHLIQRGWVPPSRRHFLLRAVDPENALRMLKSARAKRFCGTVYSRFSLDNRILAPPTIRSADKAREELLMGQHSEQPGTSTTSRRSFLQYAALAAAAPIFTEAHFARAAQQASAKPAPNHRRASAWVIPPPDAVLINANENPLGPCDAAREAIAKLAPTGGRYDLYDETGKLTKTFAAQHHVARGLHRRLCRVFRTAALHRAGVHLSRAQLRHR